MAFGRVICLAILAAAAVAEPVTPIEKVIELIKGIKDEVESDGKSEAAAYEEFACFCRDETMAKSKSVNAGHKKIDSLSADIADKTQSKIDDETELVKRKVEHQKMEKELSETEARYAKEQAEYEVEEADLAKAIQSLKDAIKALEDSKPTSLLEIKKSLGSIFEIAEAMNLLATPKHKAVAAFIQQSSSVDPADAEYKYHSNDIIAVCKDLLKEYQANKKELDDEWMKAEKAFQEKIKALKDEISANDDAMEKLKKNIAKLKKEIAEHREDLVMAKGQMEDDELYLKDLQVRCENRAHDYDQRSAMRADELAALTKALEVLTDSVEGRANAVNKRALLVQKNVIAAHAAPAMQPVVKSDSKVIKKSLSFLQASSVNSNSAEARKENAITLLRQEGKRLSSMVIVSLAERAAADPFIKVKKLIQALIERLLTEAKNEATKKGFCDTELGKARKDRDYRYEEATDLSADLAVLEAKRDSLQMEIKQLQKDIKEETKALKEATKDRKNEKEENLKTLKTAKEGLEAVKEALVILRSFYKEAAKASGPGGYVALIDASPVDEDTEGPGFKGNYAGKQNGMKAVFALLETIASDFDRTLRTTDEAEYKAHRDFVDFDQTTKASIAGKTTKEELDQADLKTTLTDIATGMDDLQTAVDLLDAALQTIEELKPTCIDTGMSYAERVKAREEEIEALKKALVILAPGGTLD